MCACVFVCVCVYVYVCLCVCVCVYVCVPASWNIGCERECGSCDDSRICGLNVVVTVVKCKRHYEIAVFLDYSDSVIIFNFKSFM